MRRAASILFVQILLTGWSEGKRWADFVNPGSQGDGSFLGVTDDFKGVANGYPGGKFFDPLSLSRGSESQLRRYQDSEIKNGALPAPKVMCVCAPAEPVAGQRVAAAALPGQQDQERCASSADIDVCLCSR